jgi:hypothetical protein
MKTLSDFKKRLSPGVKLATEHAKFGQLGVREVSRVQTNAFTLLTDKNGEMVESWCYFPKASEFEVLDKDTALIYWGSGSGRELILTYKFV